MLAYILRRLVWMVPSLVAVSFLAFFLIQLPPGDYVTTYVATLAASNEIVDQRTAQEIWTVRCKEGDGYLWPHTAHIKQGGEHRAAG